jgi:general secretion pathway protein G
LELLVVVVIIAVLAGMLLPVLSSMHESSNNAKCTSNMRQVYSALLLYTQDHANTLPQRKYGRDSTYQVIGYPEVILSYVDPGASPQTSAIAKVLYTCPSQSKPSYSYDPGYGMNWYYDNVNLALVSQPAETILLAETLGVSGIGSRRADRDNTADDIGKLDVSRHRGQANYVFFDGHMSRMAYADTRQISSGLAGGSPTDMWGTDFGNHNQPTPTPPY